MNIKTICHEFICILLFLPINKADKDSFVRRKTSKTEKKPTGTGRNMPPRTQSREKPRKSTTRAKIQGKTGAQPRSGRFS